MRDIRFRPEVADDLLSCSWLVRRETDRFG